MASGAITPAPAPIPVQPIVRTRKNVPMNSAMYLFISYLLTRHSLKKASRINNETLVLSVLRKRRALDAEHSNAESRRNVCLAFERGRAANDLRQATNFI